jgi:hypothetical protein
MMSLAAVNHQQPSANSSNNTRAAYTSPTGISMRGSKRWQTLTKFPLLRLSPLDTPILDIPYPDVVFGLATVAVHGGRFLMEA